MGVLIPVILLGLLFVSPILWIYYKDKIIAYLEKAKKTKKERFTGKPSDLVSACSRHIYSVSREFSAKSYDIVCHGFSLSPYEFDFSHVSIISASYVLCSYLSTVISEKFSYSTLVGALDMYYDSYIDSDHEKESQFSTDSELILALENSLSTDDFDRIVKYYEDLALYILVRSHSVENASVIPALLLNELCSFYQKWADESLKSLALVYSTVRPYIKSKK